MNSKTIIILGRSGSGKGTQAILLKKKLEPCLHIVAGDLFRALAQKEGLAGRKVKEILAAGGLPPEWLAEFLWGKELIENLLGEENIIFDGSPRRVGEAERLDEVLGWLGRPSPRAVLVDITEQEAITRLLKRGRGDDQESNIRARLDWFNKSVLPVIDYYENSGRLIKVDGIGSVEDVFARITKALGIL